MYYLKLLLKSALFRVAFKEKNPYLDWHLNQSFYLLYNIRENDPIGRKDRERGEEGLKEERNV